MKLFLNFNLLASLIYLLFSCSYSDYQSPYYIQLAHGITEETAKKLEKEKGLMLIGTGGQMMYDVQMMMMGFNFYKIVDIETARTLLVDSVQEYLSAINSNKKIRPYLHSYPFTAQNVEIVIYFYSPDRHKVPRGEIKIAAAGRNEITYWIDYPEKHTIKAIHEETYQDALNAVRSKSFSVDIPD